jgi:hypothetical protein
MDPGWVLALIALITTVTGLVVWLFRTGFKFMMRVKEFLDDYFGEPATHSHPERPGVMMRLDSIEHQVHLNSGETLKDAVMRIEQGVGNLRGEVASVKTTVDGIAGGSSGKKNP